jgi:hypothetical protein
MAGAGAAWRGRKGGLVSITGAAAALVVAGVAAWFLLLRDVAEPTTVGEAVTNFREDADGSESGPSPVPVGVYVYATDGFEKTDALTGVTHRYPRRSTITVTKNPCGVQMDWDVLRGRSTVWTFCIDSAGWTIASQDERHTFFGRTERTTYTCSDTTLRPAGDELRLTFPVSCSTPTAEELGEGQVVGREPMRIARKRVQTVHLRKTSSFSGAIRGTSTYDFWLDRKSGVPVRIAMVSRTTNDSAVGDVHYEEGVRLELVSLSPRR